MTTRHPNWLQRLMPTHQTIQTNRYLGVFGALLQDPNLWHFNRRSVAGAFAIGLFVMYLPLPVHSLVGTGLAIFWRVNLPIVIALVWLVNPITGPPMFYLAYVTGCWVLSLPIVGFEINFWLDWRNWLAVMPPLTLGSLICGAICSIIGYFTVQLIWRMRLRHARKLRRARHQALTNFNPPSSKRQI